MTYFIVVDKPGMEQPQSGASYKKNNKAKSGSHRNIESFCYGCSTLAVGKATRLIPYLDERQRFIEQHLYWKERTVQILTVKSSKNNRYQRSIKISF